MKEFEVIEKWGKNYAEVTRWLSKIQKKDYSAFNLYRYCEWSKKEPQELLALKENPSSRDAEKLLDDFIAANTPSFTNAVKFNIVTAVKSFYKWNYRDLAKASGQIALEKVRPYNKLDKTGLRKLWTWALNPRDKSLITFVCSTAIAKETLTLLKWQHLEDEWETKELPCVNVPGELLKGGGQGRYKGVRQITFLTPEARRDLINYKQWIEAKLGRKVKPNDAIFMSTYSPYNAVSYSMLSMLTQNLSKSTGVPFSWHDARRWVNVALEAIGISSNWARKIRGRKVRGEEAPYSQPSIDALREKFREAVPLIEFTSETPIVPAEVREKLAALEEETRRIKAQYQLRQRTRKTPKSENDGGECQDGKNCQRIVCETELETLLTQGWHFVSSLPSGKIVVSNE